MLSCARRASQARVKLNRPGISFFPSRTYSTCTLSFEKGTFSGVSFHLLFLSCGIRSRAAGRRLARNAEQKVHGDTRRRREREREREGEAGKGENLPFVFSRARSFSFLCSSGKHLVHLGGVNALALVPALETRRSTNDDPFADKADNENIILRACDAPGRLVSGRLSRRLRSSDHGRRRKRIAHNRV